MGVQIQIVGLGVVGKAQAYLMKRLGHTVTGYDINQVNCPDIWDIEVTDYPIANADLTFICTPEKVVPYTVEQLIRTKVENPFVIKSTVPPGTSESLMNNWGVHICHNPEFLREKMAFEDVLKQEFVIIGECCPEHGKLLSDIYAPLGAEIIRTQPKISELSKLVLNNYLATLITFWNEVNELSTALRIETRDVAHIVKSDARVSEYGTTFFGQPFSGKCLPKDLEQTLNLCRSLGINPKIFEAIKDFNMELSAK